MATTVEIINYKTMKNVKFTIDGYTVLLGKNYIGKSALITAIMSALTNRAGEGFIRHGAKFAEVRISHGGYDLVWHKEKKNSYYRITHGTTTNEYKKIGRSDVPPEIEKMGFASLLVSGEKTLLWHAKQLEVLFLVDKPKQNFSTDLIASVTNLDAVYKAVDFAKKDLRSAKSELKIRTSDLKQAKADLETFNPLDEYAKGADTLADLYKTCKALEKDMDFLTKAITALESHTASLKKYHPVNSLVPVSLDAPARLRDEIVLLSALKASYDSSSEWYESKAPVLAALKEAGDGSDTIETCKTLIDSVRSLGVLHTEYVEARQVVDKYKAVADIPSAKEQYAEAVKGVKELVKLSGIHGQYQAALRACESLEKVGSLKSTDLKPLRTLLDGYRKLHELKTMLDTSVADLKLAHKEKVEAAAEHDEIHAELGEFKDCPTCGAHI